MLLLWTDLAHILCRTSRHLGRWMCSHGVREEGQGQDGHCHCQEHKEGEKVSRVVLGVAAWRSLESPGCWMGHLSRRGSGTVQWQLYTCCPSAPRQSVI